jgi:hypothetical protein
MFKIDKNVPAPTPRKKYPLRGMSVGESFAVSATSREHASRMSLTLRSSACQAGRRMNAKFSVRVVEDQESGMLEVRVWRVA